MRSSQLFVGIDIGKYKHAVAIIKPSKQPVGKVFEITESRTDYEKLIDKLKQFQTQHQINDFFIGMEATGDYWKNLYHFLKQRSDDFHLTVINPVQTKRFAQCELRRAVTDAVSALDIARFMAEKKPKPLVDRDPIYECIKDIDRQIYALQKQLTMTKNKLRIELRKVAPEIEQTAKNLKKQQLLALLQRYPTARAIAQASVDELRALRYGKSRWRLPMNFIHEMQTLAKDSIAYKIAPGAGLIVQVLVKQMKFNQKVIELLQKQIAQRYNRINKHQSLLTTIPGIAIETAITLEAYIGDVNRFPNAKTIVAYFGLNPTIHHSGIKTRNASRIQKKGCAIVRYKLFMATLNIIAQKAEPFYSFYQRLVDKGKPKLVAICATMHKLLIIIYNILKKQKPFDPNHSKKV